MSRRHLSPYERALEAFGRSKVGYWYQARAGDRMIPLVRLRPA